jgi:hypothetical protein
MPAIIDRSHSQVDPKVAILGGPEGAEAIGEARGGVPVGVGVGVGFRLVAEIEKVEDNSVAFPSQSRGRASMEEGMGRRDERREEGVSEIWEERVWERRVEREVGEKETGKRKTKETGRERERER